MKFAPEADSGSQFKILAYRLCAFSLLGLVLLTAVNEYLEERLTNRSSNYCFEQYREMVDHKINANIIVLGSSRSHVGINPLYLNDKGKTYYNFSADAAFGYFYNLWYDLFKKYYPKPDMIILEVGNHWFDLAGIPLSSHVGAFPLKIFLDAMFNPNFPTDRDFPSDPLHPSNYKSFLKKKNKSIYLQDILSSLYPAKEGNNGAYYGYTPYDNMMLNNPANSPYYYSNDTIHHFAPNRFFNFVNKLLNDKIKVVIVDLPEFIPDRIRNQSVFKTLKDLANSESNIIFLDYNSEDNVTSLNYNGKYFHDYGHLNKEGSTIFSKKLKQDLDNIEASATLSKDSVAMSKLSYAQLTDYGRKAKQRGDHATAQLFFTESVKKAEMFPRNDPRLQYALENLASVYWEEGLKSEADLILKRIETLPDPLHPGLTAIQNTLGISYVDRGTLALLPFDQCVGYGSLAEQKDDPATARLYFEEALRKAEQFNPYDPRLMSALINLTRIYLKEGRLSDAEPLIKRVLEFLTKNLGPSHPDLIEAQNALAVLYAKQRRDAKDYVAK